MPVETNNKFNRKVENKEKTMVPSIEDQIINQRMCSLFLFIRIP